MNDLALENTADHNNKKHLTVNFFVTGVITIIFIVMPLSAGGYYFARSTALQSTVERVASEIREKLLVRVQAEQALARPEVMSALGKAMANVAGVGAATIYDASGKALWSSSANRFLGQGERARFTAVSSGSVRQVSFDYSFLSAEAWKSIVTSDSTWQSALIHLDDKSNKPIGVVQLSIDSSRDLAGAARFAVLLSIALLLATLFLFFLLYSNFRKGVQMIEKQEEKMNHQITRLSNLLTINKSMQTSIKTASARAVELNEQFLRRVGADLHDGPAQMIGFAAMRLNKISKEDAAKALGHEFHAVREALDESLDEIRGISSGLVLPELASMSFEQCLRKVVLLHSSKSDAEVEQFYSDLPDDIQLPIKICAYRFVQEGLNNAERHGKATKCRLRSDIRDGVLVVSLKDNGMGFRKSQLSTDVGHLGLMGLKDRIESLGGKFNINSELGVGTALKFSVDLGEEG